MNRIALSKIKIIKSKAFSTINRWVFTFKKFIHINFSLRLNPFKTSHVLLPLLVQ